MGAGNFEFALVATFDAEGGAAFSDHRLDPGGATRWGISEKLARAHSYGGAMSELDRATAERIARAEFWIPLALDSIQSRFVAAEIFDTAFHSGARAATMIAQRAVNLLYADSTEPILTVDGIMGPNTVGALNSLLPKYERHLYAALQGFQFVRFLELARTRPASSRVFIRGWMARLSRFPEMSFGSFGDLDLSENPARPVPPLRTASDPEGS